MNDNHINEMHPGQAMAIVVGFGVVGLMSISELNEWVKLLIGVATLIFMVLQITKVLREIKRNKRS